MTKISKEQFKSENGDKIVVMPSCSNCEFNMGGICAGGHNSLYKYGDTIINPNLSCECWGIDLCSFIEQEELNGR